MSIRHAVAALSVLVFGLSAHAQSIPLNNLTSDDLNKVVGDFSANFLHTSVSGASALGHVFGFEVGVVGGQTNTPHLGQVAMQASNGADAGKLPNGELLGMLTIPLGFTGELGLIPKVGSSGFRFGAVNGAVKWTLTELVPMPVSLAAKLSFTDDNVAFDQTVSGVPISYTYTNKSTALTALISKDLVIVEPYFGLGYVSATGTLSADSPIYNSSVTSGMSATATRTGVLWMVGAEVKLLVLKLGAEYSNLFSTSRVDGKVSFFF